MCGCFVIVSGSLGCCLRVWLVRGCFWFPQWLFSFPAGKPLSSPSRRHWFRKCWMGWGSYGTRNFANAIVASFLVSRHSVIKFRPCVLFMCSLALLRRPLSIHETCVQTHVEENLSDSKSEHVFCSSQISVKRFFLIRSRNQSEIRPLTMPTVVLRKWREIKQCSANNSPQLFGGAMHNTKNNNDALDRIHTVVTHEPLDVLFWNTIPRNSIYLLFSQLNALFN